MGAYLVPDATSVQETADYLGEPELTQTWERVEGGVRFTDSALTDAQAAALYAGYTPSGTTDLDYRKPRPPEVQEAIQTLRGFYQANPSTITAAQAASLHRAEVIVLRYLDAELGS